MSFWRGTMWRSLCVESTMVETPRWGRSTQEVDVPPLSEYGARWQNLRTLCLKTASPA